MLRIPPELLDGYKRFRAGPFAQERARYAALSEHQAPHTLVIACADSRIDPAAIFGCGPGELYVVRNFAAIVPPCETDGGHHGTSAAIEFAVSGLGVKRIVVLGHGQCSGIAAALAAADDRPVGQFIAPWVGLLAGIRDEVVERIEPTHQAARQRALERMAIQQSLENLETFAFVRQAIDAGRLRLDGAWFSIAAGELHWLDWDSGVFEPVDGAAGLGGDGAAAQAS